MKIAVHKVTAIGLALLILSLPALLSAQERRGADLVVTLKDGQTVTGELIAVKPDSLLLLSLAGKDEAVDIAGVREIRVVRKSRAGKGALYGFLVGAAVATVSYLGLSAGDRSDTESYLMWVAVYGAPGALIGLGAGALAGKDKTIRLEGISESALKKVLADLSAHARIPDFK